MSLPRGTRLSAALAVLAVVLPFVLERLVSHVRETRLVPALAAALGREVSVEEVELELLGTLRLDRVRVVGATPAEPWVTADSIQASVALGTLLSGQVAADEISVAGPRLSARLRPDGTLDLADLVQHRHRAGSPNRRAAAGRVRRIVVTDGMLVLRLAGYGEIRAEGVELHPQEGGVRVVTSRLSIDLARPRLRVDAEFARGAADLALPHFHVGRAALDGGRVTVASPGAAPLLLDEVVLSRRLAERGAGADETRLTAVQAGHPLSARLTRGPGGPEVALEGKNVALGGLSGALPTWLGSADARISGKVALRADDAGEVWVSVDADVAGLALTHPLLAAEPLPLAGHITLDGALDPASREASGTLRLATGALLVDGAIEAAWQEDGTIRRGRVTTTIPPTSCAGALAAIPHPLRRRLDGLDLDGSFGARLELAFDVDHPEDAALDLDLDVACRVLADAAQADPTALLRPYAHRLPDGSTRVMDVMDPAFTPLGKVPAHVAEAFVAGEDARFFKHAGFDDVELKRSFAIDVAQRRIERGGSTISQQLVKNLWLGRERTLGRKLLEAILTWRLEQVVSKDRILEVYLNLVELGEGVYGIGPAARRWFDEAPDALDAGEAAFLAALTPAPVSTDRRLRAAGQVDDRMKQRVHAVLRSMRVSRFLDEERYRHARRATPRPRI